jgi:uncharacterized protein YutE (UPF0331/DUF86 family)
MSRAAASDRDSHYLDAYLQLRHYAANLTRYALTLPEDEVGHISLVKRAANDYLNQIMELAHDTLGYIIKVETSEAPGARRGARLEQAARLAVCPASLATLLNQLRELRNAVVHEDARWLQERLPEVVLCGWSLVELVKFYRRLPERPRGSVTIDASYVRASLDPATMKTDERRTARAMKAAQRMGSHVIVIHYDELLSRVEAGPSPDRPS